MAPRPAILDIRGDALLMALECRPLLVKPNREELAHTLGCALGTDRELQVAMRELNDRGATWVMVTDGAGPVWASSAEQVYRIRPPRVEVVNPIGSGDCAAAGIAEALTRGVDPLGAICHGIAAAIENVGQLLPARIDPEFVARRAEHCTAERI